MTKSNAFAWAVCALLWAAPVCARAQEPPGSQAGAGGAGPCREPPRENRLLRFFRSTEVDGYADAYYAYNFNRPPDGFNTLRAFDERHHRPSLSAVGLAFEKRPEASSRFGYRLDLIFGPAADYLGSGEPRRADAYKYFHEAYVSYLAPAGGGLRLDFGKMVSWSGVESDRVSENWNYSLGLVSLAQPGYHTGLRATYSFGPRLSLMGAVVNGWDSVEENNGGKTFGLSVTLAPASGLTLTQGYTVGPEQPGDRRRKRHLFDTVITYDLNERLSVLANYDYGFDRLAGGSRVRWQGVSAAFRYAPAERLAFSPRFEWFGDYDGFITETPQRLRGVTLTGEYRLGGGLLARLEYRRDWSDRHVFPTADPALFRRTQATLASGLVWSFDTRTREAAEKQDPAPERPPPATKPAPEAPASAGGPARPAPTAIRAEAASAAAPRPKLAPFRFGETDDGPGPSPPAPFSGNLFGHQ